jgi:hypothetical protein
MACKCGSEFIVNKKYNLCEKCNYVRLHGVTELDHILSKGVYPIKEDKKVVRAKKKRVDHSISKRTHIKRIEQVQKDQSTYLEVFLKSPNVCEECGNALPDEFRDENGSINCIGQFSHILSKAAYPEFRNDARNFNRLCPNPCHDRWESHDKENMNIYEKNQIIIQQLLDERNAKTFDRCK